MFGKMSVKSVYRKHYPRILAIAKRLSIAEDPEFEILPAMMFLSLRVLVDNGKDKQLGSCVTQEIAVRCPEIKGPVLKRRMRLYSDIINNNKPLVCQWFYDDPSCIIGLAEALELDSTISSIANIPCGYMAERESATSDWTIIKE